MEHKARSLISASFVFLGLLIPLRLANYFWYIITAVAIIGALLVFWVFAEYPSLKRLKEDWFTIVFIFFFVMAIGVFGYLVPHPIVQALILGSAGIFVYFLYMVASRLKRNYIPSLFLRNIVTLASILGVFFSIASVQKWIFATDTRLPQIAVVLITFVSVFIISEFLFEVQGFEKSLLYSLALSFALSQIVWISSFWLISYPQSERITNIGVPLPAIVGAVFYYLLWGISHHRLEQTLTRRIVWEYILIAGMFITIIFVTAKWLP
jgi:hypothetical protein